MDGESHDMSHLLSDETGLNKCRVDRGNRERAGGGKKFNSGGSPTVEETKWR